MSEHKVIYTTNNASEIIYSDDIIDLAKSLMAKYIFDERSQLIVVFTDKGNAYHTFIHDAATAECRDEYAFIDELKNINETELRKMVCVWGNQCFDMPSYVFRKAICEMNKNNGSTALILSGEGCFVKKKIADTFPRK